MSVITGTSSLAAQIPPATAAAGSNTATSQTQAASQPPITSGNAAQPAVVVSLSSGAAAVQTSSTPRSMDPNAVDDALSQLSGANGFAFNYAHMDYAVLQAAFGTAIANRDEAQARGAAVGSASDALSNASELGIPATDSVSPNAVQNGAAPGTITVAAFSFTSGGATYSITPGANGTLVGTKDGQAWQTWQLIPTGAPGNPGNTTTSDSGAATALQTLTSLNAQAASTGTQSSALDILG
jgi:hypothetical protein